MKRVAIPDNNTFLEVPIGGKICTYDDTSKEIIIIYRGNNNQNYEVVGNIISATEVALSRIKATTETGKGIGYGQLDNTYNYLPVDLKVIKTDINYIVVKDFIDRHLNGYRGIAPTQAKELTIGLFAHFLLMFTKGDQSEWKVEVEINTKFFVVIVESETLLKAAPVGNTTVLSSLDEEPE